MTFQLVHQIRRAAFDPDSRIVSALRPAFRSLQQAAGLFYSLDAQIFPGISMKVMPICSGALSTFKRGEYEAGAFGYLKEHFPASGSVFDIGANLGFYSVAMHRLSRSPNQYILAFEPSPASHSLLRRHLEINRCPRVVPLATALGARSGFSKMQISRSVPHCGTNSLVAADSRATADKELISVSVSTVDTEAMKFRATVRMMKIDTEGTELAVLAGARGTLLRDRPHIIVELHPHLWEKPETTAKALLDFTEGHNYRLLRLSAGRPEVRRHGDIHSRDLGIGLPYALEPR